MLTTAETLPNGDILIEMDADWAFLGIVDCASYESFIGEQWDWCSLVALVVRQMNQERVFAWGCPEGRWKLQFSRKPLPGSPAGVRDLIGYVKATGGLCLTSLDGFAMCAQFSNYHLPLEGDDWPFSAPSGRYKVTVRQLFRWNGRAQFPSDEFPDEQAGGINYLISLVQDDEGAPRSFDWIPLALGPKGEPPST